MPVVAKLHGIQGPCGFMPTETLVHYATEIPMVRREVIAALKERGYLKAEGVVAVPWWRRIFARKPKVLEA